MPALFQELARRRWCVTVERFESIHRPNVIMLTLLLPTAFLQQPLLFFVFRLAS